jgi:hypothetical protein
MTCLRAELRRKIKTQERWSIFIFYVCEEVLAKILKYQNVKIIQLFAYGHKSRGDFISMNRISVQCLGDLENKMHLGSTLRDRFWCK